MGQSSVWFAIHLISGSNIIGTPKQPLKTNHKAFVSMDDVEESEEDIHGDDFEGVKDNDPDLHVPGAVEAGPCLHNIGFRD